MLRFLWPLIRASLLADPHRLHKVRDGRMAQSVAHYLFDIQPRRKHAAAKWLI